MKESINMRFKWLQNSDSEEDAVIHETPQGSVNLVQHLVSMTFCLCSCQNIKLHVSEDLHEHF